MELGMKAAVDAPSQGYGAAQHSIFLPMMTESYRHNRSPANHIHLTNRPGLCQGTSSDVPQLGQ